MTGAAWQFVDEKGRDSCLRIAYDTNDYHLATTWEIEIPFIVAGHDYRSRVPVYEFNLLPGKPLHIRGIGSAPEAIWKLSMQVRDDQQTGQQTILKYPKEVPVTDQAATR